MKERPIIFSGEMVRAILEGKKTQTRRVVKPQPPIWCTEFGYTAFTPKQHISGRGLWEGDPAEKFFKCPFGVRRDRLWVRETWQHHQAGVDSIVYRATDDSRHKIVGNKWASPRFMPRWASRINLEITNLRVERVQDISEEDALKEGIQFISHNKWTMQDEYAVEKEKYDTYAPGACSAFMFLWNLLNEKRGYSFGQNPWVWVLEFKKL